MLLMDFETDGGESIIRDNYFFDDRENKPKKFKLFKNVKSGTAKGVRNLLLGLTMVSVVIGGCSVYTKVNMNKKQEYFKSPEGIAECIMYSNEGKVPNNAPELIANASEITISGSDLVNGLINISDDPERYVGCGNILISSGYKEDMYLIAGNYFSEDGNEVVSVISDIDTNGERYSHNITAKSYDELEKHDLVIYIDAETKKVDAVLIKNGQ